MLRKTLVCRSRHLDMTRWNKAVPPSIVRPKIRCRVMNDTNITDNNWKWVINLLVKSPKWFESSSISAYPNGSGLWWWWWWKWFWNNKSEKGSRVPKNDRNISNGSIWPWKLLELAKWPKLSGNGCSFAEWLCLLTLPFKPSSPYRSKAALFSGLDRMSKAWAEIVSCCLRFVLE